MNCCIRCRSYAINPTQHGRDGTDNELCDVCYWRYRAEVSQGFLQRIADQEPIRHADADAPRKWVHWREIARRALVTITGNTQAAGTEKTDQQA